MYTKKHLSFSAIRKALAALCESIDDKRQSGKVEYSFHDCLKSALTMMFFQDPSVLSLQRRMQDKMQNNNLKALFGVEKIPSDSSLCQSMDAVPTQAIHPAFSIVFQRLQRGRQLIPYKLESSHYLVALDGFQYFSSEKINCPSCLTYKAAKGSPRYLHQIVQAAPAGK